MSGVLAKILSAPAKFPLVRGMLSYAIIWPTCSLVQEYLEHGTGLAKANWARAARFSFFGTFFMAPVFYGWMKYSSRFFKRKDLMTAISRAAVEQVTYSPLAMAYFFFGMSMLEGKPYKVCMNEVREKFWPTYKMGVVFWPTAQTLNFYYISEKNRIVFVSLASFVWTVYLAHMKGKDQKSEKNIAGSDPSLLNIEPMSANLDPEESKPAMDNANLVASEISEISSVISPNTVADIDDIETGANALEGPMLVVDTSDERGQKPPQLVSDIHPDAENLEKKQPQLVSDLHSDTENLEQRQPQLVSDIHPETVDREQKQPQLVSDIHPDGESHLVVETLSEDAEEEEEETKTRPRMTVEEMAEILYLMW